MLAQVPDEWLADGRRSADAVRARYVDQLLARLAARDAWLPGLVAAAAAGGGGPPPRAAWARTGRPGWARRRPEGVTQR